MLRDHNDATNAAGGITPGAILAELDNPANNTVAGIIKIGFLLEAYVKTRHFHQRHTLFNTKQMPLSANQAQSYRRVALAPHMAANASVLPPSLTMLQRIVALDRDVFDAAIIATAINPKMSLVDTRNLARHGQHDLAPIVAELHQWENELSQLITDAGTTGISRAELLAQNQPWSDATRLDVTTARLTRSRRVTQVDGRFLAESPVKRPMLRLATASTEPSPQPTHKTQVARPHKTQLARPHKTQVAHTHKTQVATPIMPPSRNLTPEQVDPEFTGTPAEFVAKYGHVQIHTAQERATDRFSAWAIAVAATARAWKNQPSLGAVDLNWLRAPKPRDIARLEQAIPILETMLETAKALLEKAKGH